MSPVFRHGRLRLYLLKLLDESPRHGYEVIRLLQDRFMGVYSPSPGTIYPRLARLEEEGLVTHDEVEGKKVYRITDKGREELHARLDDIAELEEEITASVRDIAREVTEDVRETVRSLREELTWAAREFHTRARQQASEEAQRQRERPARSGTGPRTRPAASGTTHAASGTRPEMRPAASGTRRGGYGTRRSGRGTPRRTRTRTSRSATDGPGATGGASTPGGTGAARNGATGQAGKAGRARRARTAARTPAPIAISSGWPSSSAVSCATRPGRPRRSARTRYTICAESWKTRSTGFALRCSRPLPPRTTRASPATPRVPRPASSPATAGHGVAGCWRQPLGMLRGRRDDQHIGARGGPAGGLRP